MKSKYKIIIDESTYKVILNSLCGYPDEYKRVVMSTCRMTEKGFIAVAIMERLDGQFISLNYHPLRDSFQETHLVKENQAESSMNDSMKSLERLLVTL